MIMAPLRGPSSFFQRRKSWTDEFQAVGDGSFDATFL